MENRIARFTTVSQCETFSKNAIARDRHDLANLAKKRSVQIKASNFGATEKSEVEVLEAIYAYEETLTIKNGRKTRATRTWQMVKKHGLIQALESIVCRPNETTGFKALQDMGMLEFAFESVVLRYPDLFSEQARLISAERLAAE